MKRFNLLFVILTVLCLSIPAITFAQPAVDVDIPDDLGNLVGNTMTMNIAPGYSGTGQFWVVCASATNNPDPDPWGVGISLDGEFYSNDLIHTTNPLAWIPASGNISFSYNYLGAPYGGGAQNNITVNVPLNQNEGTYEAWVVCYDMDHPESPDSFLLRVVVGAQEDVDIVEDYISGTAGAGDTLVHIGTFRVLNPPPYNNPDPDPPSNTDLYNLRFAAQNLVDTSNLSRYIPISDVYLSVTGVFGPTPVQEASIGRVALGDSFFVDAWVSVPKGTKAGTYKGQIQVQDDDGWPSDVIGVWLDITPSYDLDISDNTGNLVGNWMSLSSGQGTSPTGYFVLINPNNSDLNVDPDMFGNTDLDSIVYLVSDLVHITNPLAYMPASDVTLSIVPYYSLASGASENVTLTVNIPYDQIEGEYTAWVRVIDTLTASTWIGDSFQLRVTVGPQEDIDIFEPNISGTGSVNDTLLHLGQFTIINPDPSWNPDPDGPSNTDLYNLRFSAQNLMDTIQQTRFISSEHIYLSMTGVFGPTPVYEAMIPQLVLGDTAIVDVWVHVPYGTRAAAYKGQIQVADDDGWPTDVVGLLLTILPMYDLDISDNTGNLVGNWMSFTATNGTTVTGQFNLINPNNPDLNVDPDIFGNTDLFNIRYQVDTLSHITNPLAFIPNDVITFSQTSPDTLLSGASENITLTINVPYMQIAGQYTGWVRVVDDATGVGDSFQLSVIVRPQEDIDIYPPNIFGTTNVDDTLAYIGRFWVINPNLTNNFADPDGPSNIDLDNLRFAAQNMLDTIHPNWFIPSSEIYLSVTGVFGPTPVDQANIGQLALGDTAKVDVYVHVPYGTRAATYKGQIQVQDDDGLPSDVVGMLLTVFPSYDLDISDNEQNLVANTMVLADVNSSGRFRLINPNTPSLNVDPDMYGNADLTGLQYNVSTLVSGSWTIPPSAVTFPGAPTTLASGASVDQLLLLTIPVGQHQGVYFGKVWVTSAEGPSDTFGLVVLIGANSWFISKKNNP